MICSGGPTLIPLVNMNLAKLIGVGAGRNAGLPLDPGKSVFLLRPLAKRRCSARKQGSLAKTQIHQPQNLQFQLNPRYLMGRELQRLEGYHFQMLKNHLPVKGTPKPKKKAVRKSNWLLSTWPFLRLNSIWLVSIHLC